MIRTRCPGYARHWFGVSGYVGVRAPICERCGAPNPRKLTQDELAEYEQLERQLAEANRAAGVPQSHSFWIAGQK